MAGRAGLRNWTDYGIRNYSKHPERQEEYFRLDSADSRAVVQRERHGTLFAEWQGQALIANLGSQTIVRVATDAAAGTATEEARYRMPRRLRDIAEAADGSLWVVEDGGNGRLLRLREARAAA